MHPDGTAHGGSAILIKENIKHHQGEHTCTKEIQATNIIIDEWNGPVTISSIYSPPRHNIKKEQYKSFFSSLGNRFISCGDYNAKHTSWGSRLITPKGRQLLSAINSLHLNITSPYSPTYWPTDQNKIPDLIDFCISKGFPAEYQNCHTLPDLSSDHSPVLLNINSDFKLVDQPSKLHGKKTNWDYYQELIKSSIDLKLPLKTEDDITNGVQHFINVIQQAAWDSTPIDRAFNIPKCSAEIRKKLSEKRKARKRWQISRSPVDRTILNKHTSDLKKMLSTENDKILENEIRNLDSTKATDYSLWKLTRKIKSQPKTNFPIRKNDNSWTKSNSEKAQRFAEHLKQVFTPNESLNHNLQTNIESFLSETHQLDLPLKTFSKSEIKNAIHKLKMNKAPGYDLITPKALKEMPKEGITLLTYIFNACLTRCFIPPQWKVAQISMIQKPGKPAHQVSSYRPISLLPIPAKILESLFVDRLMTVIEEKAIIPNHQFGFRKKHGTIEQIHRIVETINHTFEHNKYCTAAFLDISQAFDKVWHDGLLYKLKKLLPINFYLFLKSYVQDRYFYVKEEGDSSPLCQINAGVPQGSVLGPALYLLYTYDLPQTDDVTIGTFADDTAVLSVHTDHKTASENLQICIDNISNWLKDWRIMANELKSVQISFTLKQETCPPIMLNQSEIPQKTEVKYLGMYLDKRLTWKKHIEAKRMSLDINYSKFNFLLNSKSQLSLENKLSIYKTILKPIWTYGIQLWGTASDSNIEILRRFQSKTLRTIARAPWFIRNKQLHRDLEIATVDEEIKAKTTSYKSRLEHHPNQLALNLMRNVQTFSRLRRRAPQDLLLMSDNLPLPTLNMP